MCHNKKARYVIMLCDERRKMVVLLTPAIIGDGTLMHSHFFVITYVCTYDLCDYSVQYKRKKVIVGFFVVEGLFSVSVLTSLR